MTLKLCGFSASNYYNQVKLQLLEKQLPFEEEMVRTGSTDASVLDRSPMGKVPFLDTGIGCISESMACAEFLEAAYPQHALLPADPFAAAKVRELVIYTELHLELVARELYAEAYFGGTVSDETKERVRRRLSRGVEGFACIAMFKPFVAGDQFTLADCAAIVHLPVVAGAAKIIYGEDLLAALPVKDYIKAMGERPAVARVNADRKTDTQRMMAENAAKR
ncbi:MAG: glutathione S-transferase [Rhodoferax sp.]|nr:glutathione S-transferase [Rhodoferax sp.]